MTQIAVEYDGVDGSDGKSIKKSSKSQRIIKKSEKLQRPKKSTKIISSEELSFLTSDTRLATMENCWP